MNLPAPIAEWAGRRFQASARAFQMLKSGDERQEAQQNEIRGKLQALDKSQVLQTAAAPNAP